MRSGYRDLLIALFVLGIVLGLVLGGGVIIGRNTAPQSTPIAGVGGAGAAAAGAAATATGGGGGTQNLLAGQTIGTIASVDGDALTVRGLDGRTTTLAESLSTRVTNSVPGGVSDLRPGSLVAISPGPPDAQGRTIATSILILPAGLTGGTPTPGGASGARPSSTPSASATASGASSARPSSTPSAPATASASTAAGSATPQR
jgi:hypothetical protein